MGASLVSTLEKQSAELESACKKVHIRKYFGITSTVFCQNMKELKIIHSVM